MADDNNASATALVMLEMTRFAAQKANINPKDYVYALIVELVELILCQFRHEAGPDAALEEVLRAIIVRYYNQKDATFGTRVEENEVNDFLKRIISKAVNPGIG